MFKNINPEVIFDLVVLCFFWDTSEENLRQGWSTIDKSMRILHGLGIISEKQRKLIHRDVRAQAKFSMQISFISGGFQPRKSEGHTQSKHEMVLNAKSIFVASCDFTRSLPRKRLLRNSKLYLTTRGREYAEKILEKYHPIIAEETYLAECKRQDNLLSEKAKGAVMNRYNQKVDREVNEA